VGDEGANGALDLRRGDGHTEDMRNLSNRDDALPKHLPFGNQAGYRLRERPLFTWWH
jgi:hypothetical protein